MTRKWLLRAAWAAGLCLSAHAALAAPVLRVIYPRPETPFDARTGYPLAVLRLALEHLHAAFVLKPSTIVLSQARTLRLLEENQVVTVGWSVATAARDRRLRVVPIPIDRGLIGWRVLMIRRGDESRFRGVLTKAQLAQITMAQGQDWPDLTILRDNGFDVTGAADYNSLFEMLAMHRVNAVPRSVSEIGNELERSPAAGLAVESHLLLHYPSSLVFFVSKSNASLATDLQKGLERAISDGSFQTLFNRTYGDTLKALRLHDRKVIALTNPLLPPSDGGQDNGMDLQLEALP